LRVYFDGKVEAAPDSTNIDQRTCTSSHGHDLTSLYKMYNPLPILHKKQKLIGNNYYIIIVLYKVGAYKYINMNYMD